MGHNQSSWTPVGDGITPSVSRSGGPNALSISTATGIRGFSSTAGPAIPAIDSTSPECLGHLGARRSGRSALSGRRFAVQPTGARHGQRVHSFSPAKACRSVSVVFYFLAKFCVRLQRPRVPTRGKRQDPANGKALTIVAIVPR